MVAEEEVDIGRRVTAEEVVEPGECGVDGRGVVRVSAPAEVEGVAVKDEGVGLLQGGFEGGEEVFAVGAAGEEVEVGDDGAGAGRVWVCWWRRPVHGW